MLQKKPGLIFRKAIYVILLIGSQLAQAQLTQEDVLDRILELQVQEDDFYDAGLFPTSRSWSFSGNEVPDNTIFFTAAICASIKHLQRKGEWQNDARVEKLLNQAQSNYWRYRSRNGRSTFNFWQTTPPDLPFPNGSGIISNERMRLPDDLYTSVLIAMAAPENDSIQQQLRNELTTYSARSNRKEVALFTPKEYEMYPAYELWFGKEMPQTFDLSVMSTVLQFVFVNDFPLNTYDSATIQLIRAMVVNRDYLHRIDEVSLHTHVPAMVMYQLAKLMEVDSRGVFSDLRKQVINDLEVMHSEAGSEMEKVLLATAAFRVGTHLKPEIDEVQLIDEIPIFSHYYISPFAVTKGRRNLNVLLPTVSWVCEAYNWMLYCEYLAYKNE